MTGRIRIDGQSIPFLEGQTVIHADRANLDGTQLFDVTFMGFGTSHVFMSSNAGASWTDIGGGLPDIPTSAVSFTRYAPSAGGISR